MLGNGRGSGELRVPTPMSVPTETGLRQQWHFVCKSLRTASGRLCAGSFDRLSKVEIVLGRIAVVDARRG